jgi:hypothetical protein
MTISKRETLAVLMLIVPKPCPPELIAARLTAWKELGASDLALDVLDMMSTGAMLNAAGPWMDRTQVKIQLSKETVDFLVKQLAGGGGQVEYIGPLLERLKANAG